MAIPEEHRGYTPAQYPAMEREADVKKRRRSPVGFRGSLREGRESRPLRKAPFLAGIRARRSGPRLRGALLQEGMKNGSLRKRAVRRIRSPWIPSAAFWS